MTDEEKVDLVVRWQPAALDWGLNHADLHGLGDELERRIPSATDPDEYIISATETKIWTAIQEVNEWIIHLPHGVYGFDADDFQKALACAPRSRNG